MKKEAKKKAKKKAKRKPKQRKPKVVPAAELSDQVKSILLHQKIHAVMKENPEILCKLVGEDEGRKFGICEAAEVFRMYNQALVKHSMTSIVSDLDLTLGKNCVLANMKLKITDITTGWYEKFCGGGLGMNGQWSANTAQTLAAKEAMLLSFVCSWPQPEEYKEEVMRMARNTFGPARSPEQISEAIEEFFGSYPLKGKKDATDRTRKKN